jgi:hypothetical protein
MFAIISGGVALTPGPNAVWWPCLAFLGGLLLAGAARLLLPVDWISDEELQRIERAESAEEFQREAQLWAEIAKHGRPGWMAFLPRLKDYALYALIIALLLTRLLPRAASDAITAGAPLPNGGSGAAIGGFTFGYVHLFGYDWTGVDLAIMLPLAAGLVYVVVRGFATLRRAQK